MASSSTQPAILTPMQTMKKFETFHNNLSFKNNQSQVLRAFVRTHFTSQMVNSQYGKKLITDYLNQEDKSEITEEMVDNMKNLVEMLFDHFESAETKYDPPMRATIGKIHREINKNIRNMAQIIVERNVFKIPVQEYIRCLLNYQGYDQAGNLVKAVESYATGEDACQKRFAAIFAQNAKLFSSFFEEIMKMNLDKQKRDAEAEKINLETQRSREEAQKNAIEQAKAQKNAIEQAKAQKKAIEQARAHFTEEEMKVRINLAKKQKEKEEEMKNEQRRIMEEKEKLINEQSAKRKRAAASSSSKRKSLKLN